MCQADVYVFAHDRCIYEWNYTQILGSFSYAGLLSCHRLYSHVFAISGKSEHILAINLQIL